MATVTESQSQLEKNATCILTPVSYTHLDVYKRQEFVVVMIVIFFIRFLNITFAQYLFMQRLGIEWQQAVVQICIFANIIIFAISTIHDILLF